MQHGQIYHCNMWQNRLKKNENTGERIVSIYMEDEHAIKEKMEALLREKAKEVYSEKIVDYGTNPKNYGTMDKFDGYAKELAVEQDL